MSEKQIPADIDSRLPRVWAAFFCLLVLVTYRLWWVQDAVTPIALTSWVAVLPGWIAWIGPAVFLPAALAVIFDPRRFRAAWWIVAIGLCISFGFDQHRLQPWAYQTAIYAIVFAVFDPRVARFLLIPLAASVYIYSAAGKLDYQFVHTVGQDFLNVFLGPLGLSESFSDPIRAKLALAFPIVELTAGILLLWRTTRRYASIVIMAIHVSLLIILGPIGLNHSLGVLCWNLALLVQAYYLFFCAETMHSDDVAHADAVPGSSRRQSVRRLLGLTDQIHRSQRWPRRVACAVVLIALVAPATERAGLWDHWLSWALYSPHNSRVAVEIHRSALRSLPPSVVEIIEPDADGDGWQSLPLDKWSIQELAVPVYPQARYQLALCCALAEQHSLTSSSMRCRVKGVANRITGGRNEQHLLGTREMQAHLANEFWITPAR